MTELFGHMAVQCDPQQEDNGESTVDYAKSMKKSLLERMEKEGINKN